MAMLAGGFGLLAAILAIVGLYGVISYMVERRRNEIGIRMALGAGRGSVVALVLREAVLLVGAGLVMRWSGAVVGPRSQFSCLWPQALRPDHSRYGRHSAHVRGSRRQLWPRMARRAPRSHGRAARGIGKSCYCQHFQIIRSL